jgi:ADP-ribose pyrophosphatase YjhB (NUDIX family)
MSHAKPTELRYCPRCAWPLERRRLQEDEPERLACPNCEFVLYLDPKVAACAICEVEGGIVLLRRAIEPGLGLWVFPGGFVDLGEPVPAAAVRETREETNLDVSLIGILDVYSHDPWEVAVVVYAAEVKGGELKPNREASEARSFPPEQIPWDELAFESTRAALRDYVHRFYPRARASR